MKASVFSILVAAIKAAIEIRFTELTCVVREAQRKRDREGIHVVPSFARIEYESYKKVRGCLKSPLLGIKSFRSL